MFVTSDMNNEKKIVEKASTSDDEKKPQQASGAPSRHTTAAPPSMSSQPRRQQPQQVRNPAKVGKANPKRDIPVFLGIVGLLFLIAWATSGIGGAKEMEKKKSVRQIQEDLRKQFEVAASLEKARKRTMECDLFLAHSSIPGASQLGVFAGKRYEKGDEVVSPERLRHIITFWM